MDKDHSGHLSVDELYVGLRNAGIAMKKEDVVNIVNSVDDDGNQSLSFNEFATLMRM